MCKSLGSLPLVILGLGLFPHPLGGDLYPFHLRRISEFTMSGVQHSLDLFVSLPYNTPLSDAIITPSSPHYFEHAQLFPYVL
jgi:hypothetical protein